MRFSPTIVWAAMRALRRQFTARRACGGARRDLLPRQRRNCTKSVRVTHPGSAATRNAPAARGWHAVCKPKQGAAMPCAQKRRNAMSISLILLIVVILLLVGALPTWPHSSGWGYWPSGGLGLVLLILIILLLMGRI